MPISFYLPFVPRQSIWTKTDTGSVWFGVIIGGFEKSDHSKWFVCEMKGTQAIFLCKAENAREMGKSWI